jgi:hypothetical protein
MAAITIGAALRTAKVAIPATATLIAIKRKHQFLTAAGSFSRSLAGKIALGGIKGSSGINRFQKLTRRSFSFP